VRASSFATAPRTEAIAQVDLGDWDVVVLDARAGFDEAVALAAAIRARYPATELPIVMLGAPSEAMRPATRLRRRCERLDQRPGRHR
jgi:DNA-binding response OmpR family regulator